MSRIQAFEEKYRSAVIQLWNDCGLVKPWNDPDKDIDRKLLVNPELFLVSLLDDSIERTVIGGYEGHRGWISYLAVAPNAQRKKIGSQLMIAIEERLKSIGCPKINLQIRSNNLEVINFYHSLGYKQDEVVSFGKRLIDD